jgi:mRNA interferase MazF
VPTAETITFRPDEDARRAVAVLTQDGTPVSTAVRTALIEAAKAAAQEGLRDEAARLAADEVDRMGPRRSCVTWRPCVRGEVYRLKAPRGARGLEQSGVRYAVVVQSDLLPLSTWLVAPTSTSARAATSRPEVSIHGRVTRVPAEQTAAVDPQRLGELAGHLSFEELRRLDAALRLVLSL